MTDFKYGERKKMGKGSGEDTDTALELNYEFRFEDQVTSGGIRNEIRAKQLLSGSKVKSVRVELVERDYRILEFILEMKFAGCAEIFEKFFMSIHGGSRTAASPEWARKRLRQLQQAGFLRSCVSITGGPNVFSATYKAYYALSQVYPQRSFPKPTGGLDTRTFLHDREMLLLRLKLERDHEDIEWLSDRSLRQGFGESFGLFGIHVPDGLMSTSSGNWIGIELEIATKSKDRYADKVSRYVKLIRSGRDKPSALRKVIYWCLRPQAFEALAKEARPYGEMFEVLLGQPAVLGAADIVRPSMGGVA